MLCPPAVTGIVPDHVTPVGIRKRLTMNTDRTALKSNPLFCPPRLTAMRSREGFLIDRRYCHPVECLAEG